MGRYGLGFGALSSPRTSRGGSPADTASLIGPAAAWTGSAGSGYGGVVPSDPVRTMAKPALRLLTTPNQAFTNRLLVGVIAAASDGGTLIDNLGLEKVIVHFEGNSLDVGAPSLRSFADANGETVRYFGWWADLQKPAGTTGIAHVYFEAVPRDDTMQNRVIGPYTFLPSATHYDAQLEVDSTQAASGLRFQSMLAALDHIRAQNLQHPLITITGGTDYDLVSSNFPYQATGWITVRANVPVTFTRPTDDDGNFRPRRGPLRFVGNNITFDFVRSNELLTEPGAQPHWLDGVNLTNSAGRNSLRWKNSRNLLPFLIRNNGWMTECNVSNLWSAGSGCQLNRGCTFTNTWGDVFFQSFCDIGNTITSHDSSWYRSYLNAINGTGPANSTLAMSGSNASNNRVLTASVNGSPVGTFTVQTGFAAFTANTNYTIENVVAWLNGLAGWSATADDVTRLAAALQADGTVGAWSMNTAGAFSVKTFFDTHADIFQWNGENRIAWGNTGTGLLETQVFFLKDADSRDIVFANNAFMGDAGVSASQFANGNSHVIFAHNTLPNQRFLLRRDFGGALRYDPDAYCLLANNALRSLEWNGSGFDADLVIANNHLNAGASVPANATGTTLGGSALGNFANASEGDFTPQGALLAYPKPSSIRYDAKNNARRSPVAPVGAERAPVGSDVTAPLITSADPSGSYVEGGLIEGQLTAEEEVSWLISGQDASLVTLDPDSGAWSLGPTEHATRSSYAFTFEAIDRQGNGASQPVALAITPPSLSATARIIYVFGQSNSLTADTGGRTPPARYTSLADTFILNRSTGLPEAYVAGTNSDDGGEGPRWGSEAEIAYQYRTAGDTLPIYIIKQGENGQNLAVNWNPDTPGGHFASLESQRDALFAWLAANTSHTVFEEVAAMNQGEADANSDTFAAAYGTNIGNFIPAFRSRISADAFFVIERIRPLGYAVGPVVNNTAGFARGYQVREGQIAGALADGNATVIDLDFDTANFTQIHPIEPTTWNIDSWTTQKGLRVYAAIAGTYTATYGSITDAVPAAFTIPASSGAEGTVISSNTVTIAGIERRAAVTLPAGLEMRILNWNDSLHTDWTETPGFIDKFQKFSVRETAPADGVTEDYVVTIGGVSATWELTGTADVTYRTDTQDWLDALATEGGASLSPTQAAGLDDFYAALDTAGLLTKVKAQVLSLGSEIASTIRIDDPAIIAAQAGVTALPWASNGYKATANNQIVDLFVDPSAVTTLTSISVTAILTELGNSTNYIVGSSDSGTPSIGLSFRTSEVRFRAHSAHVTFTGVTRTKLGPYTATSDGTTARLYDPDGIEIGSVAITPNASMTATTFRIGANGNDIVHRVWGTALSTHLTAGEVATLHEELETLRALF